MGPPSHSTSASPEKRQMACQSEKAANDSTIWETSGKGSPILNPILTPETARVWPVSIHQKHVSRDARGRISNQSRIRDRVFGRRALNTGCHAQFVNESSTCRPCQRYRFHCRKGRQLADIDKNNKKRDWLVGKRNQIQSSPLTTAGELHEKKWWTLRIEQRQRGCTPI